MENSNEQIDLIIKYIKSELNIKSQRQVKIMLNTDKEFRKMYEMIKDIGVDRLQGNLADLIPSLKQISLNMFREFKKGGPGKNISRGLPIYDSQIMPVVQGVRPSVTNSRRLKYKFDEMEMEISLNPVSMYSFELIGQVNDTTNREYKIVLKGKNYREETITDELQMFTFNQVPSSEYKINIYHNRKKIGIVDLKI